MVIRSKTYILKNICFNLHMGVSQDLQVLVKKQQHPVGLTYRKSLTCNQLLSDHSEL